MNRFCRFPLLFLLLLPATFAFGQSIRYVKPTATGTGDGSSWANASGNLQSMINSSVINDEVRLAQGLYLPTLDQDGNVNNGNPRRRTFTIQTGIRVRGGYAGTGANPNQRLTTPSTTTLSGDIGTVGNTSDNCYHVVTMPNAFSTILDGVVVTGGNANTTVSGYGTRDLYGGGILLLNLAQSLSTPLLYQVFVVNNQGVYGAGLANFGGSLDGNTLVRASNPRIQNSLFENNRATNSGGAIFNTGNASPQLTSCVFRRNTAAQYGGGFATLSSSTPVNYTMNPALTACSFESNSATIGGAGVSTVLDQRARVELQLERCSFTDNYADVVGIGQGGAVYSRSAGGPLTVTARNSRFFSNDADFGGAIYSTTTSTTNNVGVVLTNCTLNANQARSGGAVYHNNTTSVVDDLPTLFIENTILWGNTATANKPGISANGYVLPRINFSDVQGCVGETWCNNGLRNQDVNPLLGADNLTPTATSPVLNLANPLSTTAEVGAADFDGAPRIQGGQLDMGAIETDVAQTTIRSFSAGDWNNPATWNCYCLPRIGLTVVLQHDVRIPANSLALARRIQYSIGGKLRFASPPASGLWLLASGSL
ncbi:MAG: hypothetical protein EAZ91_21150 [Cytophagales bacterium]|nr:MAG: hypothetical protein EAZ91_21150 [Cytophagales bacterium]